QCTDVFPNLAASGCQAAPPAVDVGKVAHVGGFRKRGPVISWPVRVQWSDRTSRPDYAAFETTGYGKCPASSDKTSLIRSGERPCRTAFSMAVITASRRTSSGDLCTVVLLGAGAG